jgi:cytochrome b
MKLYRLFHLGFALLAIAAYLSAEELGLIHAWLGYAIAAALGLRLILGLLRQRGFELKRLIPRFSQAPVNQSGMRHPAISRLLVASILACMLGAAGTGIAMDQGGTLVGKSIRSSDEEGGEGRRESRIEREEAQRPLPALIGTARAEDEQADEEDEEGWLGELHEFFGNLLLPLVAVHILYLLAFRFDLARFMLFLERRRN